MNKRLRELMVQADYPAPEIALRAQKLAELVVAECCLKLLKMDEKTKGNHNYYKHAALEIKRHFGVE